jgi:hypothetical protein
LKPTLKPSLQTIDSSSIPPSIHPTASSTSILSSSVPTRFPTTQLVLWNTLNDCFLSNPIIGDSNQATFNSYEEAFYACEVAYPSCIGFSKDPTTALFTLYSSYVPNFLKNAQTFIVRKTNGFDYKNPTVVPTSILTNAATSTSKPSFVPTSATISPTSISTSTVKLTIA